MFSKLQMEITRTPQQECHCQAWIFPETLSLIDTSNAARQCKDQRISWALIRTIKARIQEDRHRRSEESGSTVESLLASDPPLIQEAWIQMQGWYRAAVDLPPPPYIVTIATMT